MTAVITVAVLALLVHRVRTHPAPVMSPRLFRVPSFTVANVTTLLFTSAFSAVFLSVSLWLETAADYGPLQAGLALVPGPLAVPLFATLTQRWAGTVPPRFVISVGLAIFGVGSLLLATQGGAHYATDILPGWIIIGVGIGIAMPTLIGTATADLAPAEAATGSAVRQHRPPSRLRPGNRRARGHLGQPGRPARPRRLPRRLDLRHRTGARQRGDRTPDPPAAQHPHHQGPVRQR